MDKMVESIDVVEPPETARCDYCGKLRLITELLDATIWVNGTTREGLYCVDDGCASYAQMGAEG